MYLILPMLLLALPQAPATTPETPYEQDPAHVVAAPAASGRAQAEEVPLEQVDSEENPGLEESAESPSRGMEDPLAESWLGTGDNEVWSPHLLNYAAIGPDDLKMQLSFKYRAARDHNIYASTVG